MATGAGDQEKRALSSSSTAESDEKRAKIDEEEPMPSWARDLMSEIFHVRNNTNSIMLTVNELKNNMRKVEADVESIDTRLQRLEMKSELQEERIAELETEKKALHARCDKLTDDNMRDTMTIHGIPRKVGRESWDDTEVILADFLAEHTTASSGEWLAKITRAHRGKPSSNVIHCLFRNWKFGQEVKEVFRRAQGKINNVYVLEKFSIATQDRRNLAQDRRDVERKKVPGSKLWIKYPATLMCERPGEKGYKAIATF
jgi:hypothetical protein